MGLYLTAWDDASGREFDGVEVGRYEDFAVFRETISSYLEPAVPWGARFPLLLNHEDCDGQWDAAVLPALLEELKTVHRELSGLMPRPDLLDDWKVETARRFGLEPKNLSECFFDVDGQNLCTKLIALAELALQKGVPIYFQ